MLARSHRRRARSSLVAFALVAVVGCSAETPSHELVVVVQTDFTPVVDFTAVHTELLPIGLGETMPATSTHDFVSGVRVARRTGLRAGDYTVVVTLLAAAGASRASRRVDFRLVEDDTLVVHLTRACPGGDPAACDPLDAGISDASEPTEDTGTPARPDAREPREEDAGTPADAGPPSCVREGSSTSCTCRSGETCNLTCPLEGTTSCRARCETRSDCTVECATGSCTVECEVGTDICHVRCAEGASCSVNCLKGGSCGATPCMNSAGCLVRCEASACLS